MKVYGVERGAYSDYSLGPFFATRELAEQAIKVGRYTKDDSDAHVAELTVWDHVPAQVRYFVMERYGTKAYHERDYYADGWDESAPYVGTVRNGIGIGRWNGNLRVWGRDESKVRKVFAELDGPQQALDAGIA